MNKNKKSIGERIRDLREREGITLSDLAKKVADSDNPEELDRRAKTIAALEEGNHFPSIKILLELSRALGKRLGHFTDDQTDKGIVIRRSSELGGADQVYSSNLGTDSDSLIWHFLASDKPDRHMEPVLIDLQPMKEENPKLESHEAQEFIYVISGRVGIYHGNVRHELEAGDSIVYDAGIPHHVHSVGNESARIIAVFFGFMKNEPSVSRFAFRHRIGKDETASRGQNGGNIAYYSIATWRPENIQANIIEISPSEPPRWANKNAGIHEGEEFLHVLSGKVELHYGKDKYELAEGDSAFYTSIVRHRLACAGSGMARILSVVYLPV